MESDPPSPIAGRQVAGHRLGGGDQVVASDRSRPTSLDARQRHLSGRAWLAAARGPLLYLVARSPSSPAAVQHARRPGGGEGVASRCGLFNEVPDRIEDSLFLIAFGYAAGLLWLGLLAALLAAVTAYVRALGGTFGFPQDFGGPMAKPHRMAALTLGALAAFAETWWNDTAHSLTVALVIVTAGTALTIVRRTLGIARQLKANA